MDGIDILIFALLLMAMLIVEAILLTRVYYAGRAAGIELGVLQERLRRSELDMRVQRRIDALLSGESSLEWPEELHEEELWQEN